MNYENERLVGMPSDARKVVLSEFMRGIYSWMAIGLGVTAVVAYLTASSQTMINFVFNTSGVIWGLIIAELALVIILVAAVNKLSAAVATLMFLVYSALNGLTLSSIFLVYKIGSVTSVFFICAAMFAALSLWGMFTKRDLGPMGAFLFMGLIGILLALIVNIFIQSSAMQFVISVVGVIVFAGLTAYDTQKLRYMGETMPSGDATVVRRGVILGALTLYLDFINLFLMLLRLFGERD